MCDYPVVNDDDTRTKHPSEWSRQVAVSWITCTAQMDKSSFACKPTSIPKILTFDDIKSKITATTKTGI